MLFPAEIDSEYEAWTPEGDLNLWRLLAVRVEYDPGTGFQYRLG